ncbi:hypothetical protein HN903_04070 [archaeon]|jgi:hypothetical protein|nr:hypothetical protein [archaeon]MBT7128906.1 hypothetical protein [archaeon]MBT7483204.1 hypothetical protein [Candidatus Peregrinibacteria bacterium]
MEKLYDICSNGAKSIGCDGFDTSIVGKFEDTFESVIDNIIWLGFFNKSSISETCQEDAERGLIKLARVPYFANAVTKLNTVYVEARDSGFNAKAKVNLYEKFREMIENE